MTTPLAAARTGVPAGAEMLTPSLNRLPGFGPKADSSVPSTGQMKALPPSGMRGGPGVAQAARANASASAATLLAGAIIRSHAISYSSGR